METAPLASDVERRKLVRLQLRPDLSITTQRYEGRTYYVVKDPVSLRYYRLDEKHCFLVRYLDGTHTLDDVQKEFEKRFRPDRLTLEELEAFAQQLLTAGLAHNESPQAGKQLFDRRKKRLRQEWLQVLTNILYIKLPVFDPDKLLERMLPYLSWIFTSWFFILSIAFMLGTALFVAVHFETFWDTMVAYRQSFGFKNLAYMWVGLMFVKVIHEFGHGLSCKAFGGECHEMGALILCLSPALYCNVSDAWTLPNKWRRITISFAGIYVELIIAALSTIIWWNTPSRPIIHNFFLNLMVLCSVSTVLFNGNPLMRYDGYYILADWLEIPNLRDRANRFLKQLVLEHCLGVEVRPEPYMALGRRILFLSFTLISYFYRWFITFAILVFMSRLLEPYKLGVLSKMLAAAALGSMVGWPLFNMCNSIYKRGRLPDMKRQRVTISVGVVGLVLLCFFLVPLPVLSRVRQTALVELQPDASTNVFVPEPAILEVLYVRPGQHVQENDLLAEFRSLDLEKQLAGARSEYTIRAEQLRFLRQRVEMTNDAQELPKIRSELSKVEGDRAKYAELVPMFEQRISRLEIRAPRAGVVMNPPPVDVVGKLWDKDQDAPFCTIGDPDRLRALMPVPPADYRLLKLDLAENPDLAAAISVHGRGGQTWQGHIEPLPESDASQVPEALTTRGGGPLAIKANPSSPRSYEPQSQQYLVSVDFIHPDRAICPGTLAHVKIYCRWRTAAWWAWRTISGTFDLGLM